MHCMFSFEERCGQGTLWDEDSQTYVVAHPSDTDFDGCVEMTDLLDLLSVFGTCVEVPWTCGDPLEYQGYDYETVQLGAVLVCENLRNENFNDGTPINFISENSDWSQSWAASYCLPSPNGHANAGFVQQMGSDTSSYEQIGTSLLIKSGLISSCSWAFQKN